MTDIAVADIEKDLVEQVAAVSAAGGQVEIVGSGSKRFYGEPGEALAIEVAGHSGIIDYDPAELVITLRAGCRLREVEALLAANNQMLGFEPPRFGADATIGGMLAAGLAGPRRAWAGGIRDYVLGVKLLDGRGEILNFGGRVIKNVAGFDVSRVLVGSLGTLGIMLEVSLRVIPCFEQEMTLAFDQPELSAHLRWINELGAEPHPISASGWFEGRGWLRLSGSAQGVEHAAAQLGGDAVEPVWDALREQTHAFFDSEERYTRVSLPSASDDVGDDLPQLVEWGGAQRWLRGDVDIAALRERAATVGGNVCAWRNHGGDQRYFQALPGAMLKLQRNIKSSFDPAGIFNPGRLYPEL